jgi:hypothetical protein
MSKHGATLGFACERQISCLDNGAFQSSLPKARARLSTPFGYRCTGIGPRWQNPGEFAYLEVPLSSNRPKMVSHFQW